MGVVVLRSFIHELDEYRYCIYETDSKKPAKFIDMSDSLFEIVLGEQVTDTYTKMLYEKCQNENISLSKLEWINGYAIKRKVEYEDMPRYPSMEERIQQEIRQSLAESQVNY